jgi:hypothetical protein
VIEDWKKALDKNEYLAAILMDLSKEQVLPVPLLIWRERLMMLLQDLQFF